MLVDGINLTADSANGIAKGSLGRIELTDGRLQFKCGIDEGVGSLVNVLTQLLQLRNTVYKSICLQFNVIEEFLMILVVFGAMSET